MIETMTATASHVAKLIAGLVAKRTLVWCDDHTVRVLGSDALITAFMPDGKTVAGGASDLLGLWLNEQLEKNRKRAPKP